jgi:hypothetical protein
MIGTDSSLLEHYGRPARFHHEAERQNWARAWRRVTAPVLVIHGAYDWIMSDFDQDGILRVLRPRMNSEMRYVNVPGMGTTSSSMDRSRSRSAARTADSILPSRAPSWTGFGPDEPADSRRGCAAGLWGLGFGALGLWQMQTAETHNSLTAQYSILTAHSAVERRREL